MFSRRLGQTDLCQRVVTGIQQQLKVGDSTNITRDGSSVSFTQLQSGDEVRASFDPTTKQATTLEVQTKQKKQ